MRAFVTGGAGFIGSHLVDALLARGDQVTVYDRLSTGSTQFLEGPLGLSADPKNPRLSLVRGDILDIEMLQTSMKGHDIVFHLAANADVRGGTVHRRLDYEQNVVGTQNLLDGMQVNGVRALIFVSSAVVYGEPSVFPTPESYKGTQTSLYGASKLAAEAAIEAYAHYDGIRTQVIRLVSLVGERYTHGVVFDFVRKLRDNPHELEILGDGRQCKSYLYVLDAVRAMLLAEENGHRSESGRVEAYNVGSNETLEAKLVADIVCDELGLDHVQYRYAGGKRGWPGDSPRVVLDTRKIEALGWRPTVSPEEGIRRTVRYLRDHPALLDRPAARRMEAVTERSTAKAKVDSHAAAPPVGFMQPMKDTLAGRER